MIMPRPKVQARSGTTRRRSWSANFRLLIPAALLIGCVSGPPEPTTPAASQTADVWPICRSSDGFSVAYPPTWFVHSPNADRQIADCMLFGAAPFDATDDETRAWTGAQVVVTVHTACRGSFDEVVTEEELAVGGFPAWARELAPALGPSAGQVSAYEYFINLTPGRRCESGRSIVVRTEVGAPGDFIENKDIVDLMVSSMVFGQSN